MNNDTDIPFPSNAAINPPELLYSEMSYLHWFNSIYCDYIAVGLQFWKKIYPGWGIGQSKKPVPNKTSAPGRIRTHNSSKRASTDLRLTPCGLPDRKLFLVWFIFVRQDTYIHIFRDNYWGEMSGQLRRLSKRDGTWMETTAVSCGVMAVSVSY